MIALEKGITLIEASAGTGKTYTLCRLALRLTLLDGIALDRILAVTFTEAATEELAARIKALYRTCLREIESGDIEQPLLKECLADIAFDAARAKTLLRYSLEVFDECPISTIHGFCKRALDLAAVETLMPLDAQLGNVDAKLVEELQDEYIRQHILEASKTLSLAYHSDRGHYKRKLSSIGKEKSAHPFARLEPKPAKVEQFDLDALFQEIVTELEVLVSRLPEYEGVLKPASVVFKYLNGKKPDLHALIKRGTPHADDFKWMRDAFSVEKWEKARLKAANDSPVPAVVERLQTFCAAIFTRLDLLVFQYGTWLPQQLAKAKERQNMLSYNDLLHHLKRALYDPENGANTTASIAGRFDAALIDEFQDTDQTQLDIIYKLFGSGEHFLCYVGDPKQAIYRFRGADIYAYFKAVQDVRAYTLDCNYRSHPALVQATNHLLQASPEGFVDPRIRFEPVRPGRDAAEFAKAPPAGLQFVQLTQTESEKPLTQDRLTKQLAARAAEDFIAFLEAFPQVSAGDTAFLVNNRNEGAVLQEALLRRGIAAALSAEQNIFHSNAATTLRQLLTSLAQPTQPSLKRGLLLKLRPELPVTRLLQVDFVASLAPFFDALSQWAREWDSRNFEIEALGVVRLLDDLLGTPATHSPSAARDYSDLCQLCEIVSDVKSRQAFDANGLLAWFSRRTADTQLNEDEHETRLSADGSKPRILTVHKSKGLEFPRVVLPFLSLMQRHQKMDIAAFHETSEDDALVLNLDSDHFPEAFEKSQTEALAEQARLLYVALTRAVQQTLSYLCPEERSARANKFPSSFATLLLGDPSPTTEAVTAKLEKLANELPDCFSIHRGSIDEQVPQTLYRPALSAPDTAFTPVIFQLSRAIPWANRILSFSALNRSIHHDSPEAPPSPAADESSDHEAPLEAAATAPVADSGGELSIFSLPKGTHAGDLLHLILERFDFARPDTLGAVTREAFVSLQFPATEFEPIVAAQILAISNAELKNPFGSFRLADTLPQNRLAEPEFSYPVSGDVKAALSAALLNNDLGKIPKSWAQRIAGGEAPVTASMLRGFIDLVLEHEGRLYLFDWKSNYLGSHPEDYHEPAILDSMADHNYFLQYLLYCVALKRYAKWRFPEEPFADRFGGVYYLYARGITPGKQSGIYYDLPSPELLDALDANLS